MGARYYDPRSGSFLSTDPLGHGECPDLYSYAHGDPINFMDPTGRGAVRGDPRVTMNPVGPNSSFGDGSIVGSFMASGPQSGFSGPTVEAWNYFEGQSGPVTIPESWYREAKAFSQHQQDSALLDWMFFGLGHLAAASSNNPYSSGYKYRSYHLGSALEGASVDMAMAMVPFGVVAGGGLKTANRGFRIVDDGLSAARNTSRLKTVLGSGQDVAPFRGKPGYNVLDMDRTLPLDVRKQINIDWLDEAIDRGDDLILKTDPIEWDRFMREIGKESFYNEVELPRLMQRGVIDDVILDY